MSDLQVRDLLGVCLPEFVQAAVVHELHRTRRGYVNRVGHERDNATAEVRRSFDGSYGPLYQIAYLIGGLQQYSLHHDLVDSGKMTNRQFNDALLHENRIPIEMIRAVLTSQKLTREYKTSWRFYPGI